MLRPGLVCGRPAIARRHPVRQAPRWRCLPLCRRRVEGHSGSSTTTFRRTGRCVTASLVICTWCLVRGRPVIVRHQPQRSARSDAIPAGRRGVPGRNGGTSALRSRPDVTCY